LLYRLLRRARVWEPHREHFYQRLVRLGWGHAGTLKLYAVLMLGSAGSAVAAVVWAPDLGPWLMVGWTAILAVLYVSIDYRWRRRQNQGIDESKC
ncbi:MAG TPA: glycosyl transferase, partial [Casimicrobiaceae bacterium]|nr:glycosyl transferase [Casimicrobiaceae bacterium]